MPRIEVEIDGTEIKVDVIGEKGKKCKSVTQFMDMISGIKKTKTTDKAEVKEIHVPAEVKIGS